MKKKILVGIIIVALIAAIVIVVISLGGKSKDKGQNNAKLPVTNKPECAHDDPSQIVIKEAVEPTCMGFGLTEGKQCKKCGTMIVVQNLVDDIPCVAGEWTLELEPTETEDGYECQRCVMCGDVLNERIVPAGTSN